MSIVHAQANVRCGDDWQFSGPLNDGNGNPLSLTGAAFVYKVDSLDEKTNVYTTTSVTIINGATATVLYGVPAASTNTIPPGTYYDTLRVTLSSGATATVIEGIINPAPGLPPPGGNQNAMPLGTP